MPRHLTRLSQSLTSTAQGLTSTAQFTALMTFSAHAFASGIPTAALFLAYIPIFTYVICAVIWAIKSKALTTLKRWALAILVFPAFALAAFFIPLLLVPQDKYLDAALWISAAALTLGLIGLLYWSIAKNRR